MLLASDKYLQIKHSTTNVELYLISTKLRQLVATYYNNFLTTHKKKNWPKAADIVLCHQVTAILVHHTVVFLWENVFA